MTPPPELMWFRRDLRLADNPALLAAAHAGSVAALFVVDPALWQPAGAPRQCYLVRSLRALDESIGGRLRVRRGDPVIEVRRAAAQIGAVRVHVSADFGPYGRFRDKRVGEALAAAGIELVETGSPYAVPPGRVRKRDGAPYQVFTPFYRAWREHGWRAPAGPPVNVEWIVPERPARFPREPGLDIRLPAAGESAAQARWRDFAAARLADYVEDRDRPGLDGTSQMSAHLKFGEIHPRTMLAELLGSGKGVAAYQAELAWREFYADVLWHRPETARGYLRPQLAGMTHTTGAAAAKLFAAWQQGRTGYPMVDAGMRQLRTEGWMHNRVRMIVASFLVKDLHIEWTWGARHFMRWLRDGDLASNSHGWQWVAGSGTDPAPYFRIFNPVSQSRKFDPDGDYIRRYVEELRGVPGDGVHEPWTLRDGLPAGYPQRIVDHAEERAESLRRYEQIKD